MPFAGSVAHVWYYLEVVLDCGLQGPAPAAACSATADFLNSATIVAAEVLDSEMNPVPEAALRSASGFDYLAASSEVTEVPVPPALVLFGSGLVVMAIARRRRTREPTFG